MTPKRIRNSCLESKSNFLGIILRFSIISAFMLLPGSVPVLAEAPQENVTPGLIHGVTSPPQKVDVRSLEPAPPVDETTPPQQILPHTRNQEELELRKQLLEEGLIKPQTDVIEDKAAGRSSETKKEQNP